MALAAWSTSSARPAVLGDVGELVEEEVVAVLGSQRHPTGSATALDVIAPASLSGYSPPSGLARRHITAVAKFLLVAIERKLRPANFAS
jgi:hypothetical protein